MRTRLALVVLISLLAISPGAAFAAFSYGNLNGNTVVYQHIAEDSTTDPNVALFGAPSISGDSLCFSPLSFGANASGAGGIDLTDGTLTASLQAISGQHIERIRFDERGDYTLAGAGTAATGVTVSASLFVRVTQIDGVNINPLTKSLNMTFSPSDGTFNWVDDRGVGVLWNGGVVIDIDAFLLESGKTGQATKVDISLDNTLLAMSEAGTVAYIKKKQAEGLTITAEVPEPATLSLVVLGGLAMLKRRK